MESAAHEMPAKPCSGIAGPRNRVNLERSWRSPICSKRAAASTRIWWEPSFGTVVRRISNSRPPWSDSPVCWSVVAALASNAEESHEWYRKAAKLGYGPAMTRLGDIEADPEWYKKAVEKQDPAAFGKLGLVTGDLGLFRRGAELGDGLSMAELGRNATDEKEAAGLVSQSCRSRQSERHGALRLFCRARPRRSGHQFRRGVRLV